MLTQARVKELLHLYTEERWELPALARRYGVTVPTVSRVVTGKTWTEITGGRNVSRAGERARYRRAYVLGRLDQGCTNHAVIANELGISRQAVRKIIDTHGGH